MIDHDSKHLSCDISWSVCPQPLTEYRLAGLVVKASASRAEDSRSNHTSDLKIGTPVATLPGAWHYRVSTGTGWPGVSIL